MVIKKSDMRSRIDKAADSTPDIDARLRHARELTHMHPIVGDHSEVPAAREGSVDTSGDRSLSGVLKGSESGASSNNYHSVPTQLIDPNPHNARRIYRPERVNELAASIGAHGQDVPGIATFRDGRYILAAGHYRLRAIKLRGLPTMNLVIHDNLSDKDLFEYSYRENAEREGQTALDNALSWKDLLNSGVYGSETELAEATGMSLPNINKTLRILHLSKDVLELVSEEPSAFALTALYELVLLEAVAPSSLIAIELAKQIKSGDAGRKEVQEARAKLEHPKTRKTKQTSRQYKINRDGMRLGTVKAWDSGRIALDVFVDDERERNDILTLLKTRFGISD